MYEPRDLGGCREYVERSTGGAVTQAATDWSRGASGSALLHPSTAIPKKPTRPSFYHGGPTAPYLAMDRSIALPLLAPPRPQGSFPLPPSVISPAKIPPPRVHESVRPNGLTGRCGPCFTPGFVPLLSSQRRSWVQLHPLQHRPEHVVAPGKRRRLQRDHRAKTLRPLRTRAGGSTHDRAWPQRFVPTPAGTIENVGGRFPGRRQKARRERDNALAGESGARGLVPVLAGSTPGNLQIIGFAFLAARKKAAPAASLDPNHFRSFFSGSSDLRLDPTATVPDRPRAGDNMCRGT